MNHDFNKLTSEQIADILNTALDNGNWHTPNVDSKTIQIQTQDKKVIYGVCEVDLHSNYRHQFNWFNINSDSVHIWQDSSLPGRHKVVNKNIYRLRDVIQKIDEYASI